MGRKYVPEDDFDEDYKAVTNDGTDFSFCNFNINFDKHIHFSIESNNEKEYDIELMTNQDKEESSDEK